MNGMETVNFNFQLLISKKIKIHNMSVSRRMYGLDILRSIAILSVVYAHGIFIFGSHINKVLYNFFALDGVTLFFVLSGFLIGGILLKTIEETDFTAKELLHFWVRRWWRTIPNYFFVLTILITYFFLQNIPLPALSALGKYFFFFQNFHSVHPSFFPEVWSLAVEEWFYFLIPLLFYISLRLFKYDRKVILLFWIIGIIILVNFYKIYRIQAYNIQDFVSWGNIIAKQVLTRLDSIMIGVLGAYLFKYHQKPWNTYKTALFYTGIALILYPQIHQILFANDSIFRNYFSLLSISFGSLFLLPQLSSIHQGQGKIYQFFTTLSSISYSLYLVHFTLVEWIVLPALMKQMPFAFTLDVDALVRYSLYWIISIALSYILYRFFEKPVLNIREKLFPS